MGVDERCAATYATFHFRQSAQRKLGGSRSGRVSRAPDQTSLPCQKSTSIDKGSIVPETQVHVQHPRDRNKALLHGPHSIWDTDA